MSRLRIILAAAALAWITVGQAAIEVLEFTDAEQEARFRHLTEELRCLVCQNQSLADSNADLAKDLRHEIYGMLKQGASDREIVDFMVARYGDFVLYRPPLKPTTYLLWTGPFILVAAGLWVLVRLVRRRRDDPGVALSTEDRERARHLLDGSGEGGAEQAQAAEDPSRPADGGRDP